MKRLLRHSTVLLSSVALGACAVGPNFHRPDMPANADYQRAALRPTKGSSGNAGVSQRFETGVDIPGKWWTVFQNAELNALIEQSLANNPSLKAMQDGLKTAWEQRRIEGAALYPTLSASFNPTRNKTSQVYSPVPNNNTYLYNVHTAQLSIGYVPDLWGGARRAIEMAGAQADIQRFQLEATALTMVSNLVNAAIQDAGIRAQIEATQSLISDQRTVLNTLLNEQKLGNISLHDVTAQQASIAQLEMTLPPLNLALAQNRDQMATLIGVTPNTPMPEFHLEQFTLPRSLPVSLPSALLNQRPDVRAAQAQIQAASAQIGIAIANRLPNVQLSATPAQAVGTMSDFFKPGYGNWTIAATLMQPIFQGGSLLHAERGARDNLLQANDQYKATVLSAIQDVADSLHAVSFDADTLAANETNLQASEKTLNISHAQLRLGDISTLSLLQAQQSVSQARLSYVQAQAARFSDSVGLFQALGGGWWNRNDIGMTPAAQKALGKSLVPW
ncbi:efflux transporter outer membrane subunit [Gluconobacter wancherniae]|uniref:efflux transporter outer membrane subunit n=1 Tax=Gluconobacter wancherniae TaxID=1307955 RepID=UPI001B8B5B58|nr:efflux transporter outer membrane subunit [Gluconobacter wancherniae]MBS1095335.1 efflux transporter outer membrane subunit [Gluconobacter wancherniae]